MDDLPAQGLTSTILSSKTVNCGQKIQLHKNSYLNFWMSQIGVKGQKTEVKSVWRSKVKEIGLGERKLKVDAKVDESSKIIYLEYT